jgi:sulfite reductase (NADPH) flavoprotein alpha-component
MESQLLNEAAAAGGAPAVSAPATVLEVIYGSQTGNAEGVARSLHASAVARGLAVNVTELNEFGVERLKDTALALILCSTYNEGNEGDMPDNAVLFWRDLISDDAPTLTGLRYSVLALGDDGYFDFCHAGQLIDDRLAELGAERLTDRLDLDIYFEDPAEQWNADMVERIAAELPVSEVLDLPQPVASGPVWDRRNPFEATLIESRPLSKAGSEKDVRHYELDLAGSGIAYTAGDSLAVLPVNDPALVDLILQRLAIPRDTEFGGVPLGDLLLHEWEIRTPSPDLLDEIASRDPGGELAKVVADREALEEWLYGRDILDLLNGSPDLIFKAVDLPRLFRPLQARQFSIASSPVSSPTAVALTVGTVRHGAPREHGGVATTYLADRVRIGDKVKVYPQPNASFSLPADAAVPIIMIGPGTGIAPFRGFLQERQAQPQAGPAWLFFGDRSRAVDYLYEEDIAGWISDGTLTRVDLAFSRDQDAKQYVQTRMTENGAELFAWLESGASVYVCGDAERMAKDVEGALLSIIANHGGFDEAGARGYLDRLMLHKRYLRDVY